MLDLFFLLVPTAAAMLALPFGLRLRSAAGDRHVRAVYLFHRSGEPLATIASDRAPPLAVDQLAPIVDTVRRFAETGRGQSQDYTVTSMRFEEEALVAVRGPHVSVCAVFRSRETGAVRREPVRFLREIEDRNVGRLDRWEEACRIADEATDAMAPLVTA